MGLSWLVTLLIFPHLKPACLEVLWPVLSRLYDGGRVLSLCAVLVLWAGKRRVPSRLVWAVGLLQLWLLTTTFLNGRGLWEALVQGLSALALCLIVDFFAPAPMGLLRGLMRCLECSVYLNLLSVLCCYPQGLYRSEGGRYACYFLGYHNSFIVYLLPAILVGLLYYKTTGRRLRAAGLIVCGTVPVVITWSATSVCGLLALGALLLVGRTRAAAWLSLRRVFLATAAADILVSLVRVMDRAMWAALFVERILRKQITLSGRTLCWDRFYQLFRDSPFLGYGVGATIRTPIEVLSHAHNMWFQMLFVGGVAALVLFLYLNFLVIRQVDRNGDGGTRKQMLAVFGALYVVYIAEAYTSAWIYLLYALAYHSGRFSQAGAAGSKGEPSCPEPKTR